MFKRLDDVEMKVKMIGKKSGAFQVKYMPTGKTANDVRAYLKEYEIKTGRKIDVLLIDYLDLMHAKLDKRLAQRTCLLKTSMYQKNYVT